MDVGLKGDWYDEFTFPYLLKGREAVCVQLAEELEMPPNIGVKLMSGIPYRNGREADFFLDNNIVNAGWVDPGYNGKVTAHPFRFFEPKLLQKGDVIALGVFYKYFSDL